MDIGGEGGKSYVALGDVGDLGQGRDLGKKKFDSIQFTPDIAITRRHVLGHTKRS